MMSLTLTRYMLNDYGIFMGTLLRKLIVTALIITISYFNSSCSSVRFKKDVYNPQTQQLENLNYAPYFQLQTELIPEKLAIGLLTQLNKKHSLNAYTLKKLTRRLLPNDYLLPSDTQLTLKNLSDQPIDLEIISINIEHKHLPSSAKVLNIPANASVSMPLGQIIIDFRLTSLNARIDYIATEHKEQEFTLQRLTHNTETQVDNLNGQ